MDPKKKKAVEGVQALMLMNASEKDYLDAALDALLGDRYEEAEFYVQLLKDNRNADINNLMAVVRGEVVN